MTIIKYSKGLIKQSESLSLSLIKKGYLSDAITYVIDWRYRTAVNLKSWILGQINSPSDDVMNFLKQIPYKEDIDERMLEIFKHVKNKITYTSDVYAWNVQEKWQTPEETIRLKTGDCEDGAILIYVLARLSGIPPERLLLMCGSVTLPGSKDTTVGHCWLAYRPYQYPMNFVFLDWCYYPSLKPMEDRSKFYIRGKSIIEYSKVQGTESHTIVLESKYLDIWFGFNEYDSYSQLNFRVEKKR